MLPARDGGDSWERRNRLNPEGEQEKPYVYEALKDTKGVLVAASDYLKLLPDSLSRHLPRPMVALGTDGFGRSEARAELRNHFEVDARFITLATLHALAQEGQVAASVVAKAIKDLEIDPEKPDAHVA